MEEEEPSSHPVTSPHSRTNSAASTSNAESLTLLAGRFISLWSTTGPRLTLSISEQPDQPNNIPIISEHSQHNDILLPPGVHDTTSASAEASLNIGSLGGASPTMGNATRLGFGGLVEAEAGQISRHLTYQDEFSDLAADAERLRLTTSTPISTLDVSQVARSIESALPFLLLVLLVFSYHHFKAIVLIGVGTFVLYRCNTAIKLQVARRGDLKRRRAMSTALVLFLYATLLAAVGLPGGNLMRILTFRGSPVGSFEFRWVLFTIALSDLFSRLIMAALKAGIIAFSRADTQAHCRRRGALLSSLDYCISVHRSMLPAPLWLKYFQNSSLPFFLSMGLSGFYLLAKAANVLEKISLASMAVGQVRGGAHGTVPTSEELSALPRRECAICQDDFRSPLRLVCGHVFCSDCVEEWLARESSCPMCRREVRRATLKPKNDGATSLLPVLC